MASNLTDFDSLRETLRTAVADVPENDWPRDALAVLSQTGCFGHAIAREFGGSQVAPADQLRMYEAVAAASLTCALILTQHDGACELLGDCDNSELAAKLLPEFAAGRALTTVGISQLTTSRRGSGPAMRAKINRNGIVLDGVMPWVTGVHHADHIVTGAVLDDGMQILACLPTDLTGLQMGEPLPLLALAGSYTGEVRCERCRVSRAFLLRGPEERVLALRAPAKPLSVSAVGIGVAKALLAQVNQRAATLPEYQNGLHGDVQTRFDALRERLYDAAGELHDPKREVPSMELRVAVNDLVVRLAVTLMTLAKGSGYLLHRPVERASGGTSGQAGTPAVHGESRRSVERLLREAMFFLVWSAPPAVQLDTIARFWES